MSLSVLPRLVRCAPARLCRQLTTKTWQKRGSSLLSRPQGYLPVCWPFYSKLFEGLLKDTTSSLEAIPYLSQPPSKNAFWGPGKLSAATRLPDRALSKDRCGGPHGGGIGDEDVMEPVDGVYCVYWGVLAVYIKRSWNMTVSDACGMMVNMLYMMFHTSEATSEPRTEQARDMLLRIEKSPKYPDSQLCSYVINEDRRWVAILLYKISRASWGLRMLPALV